MNKYKLVKNTSGEGIKQGMLVPVARIEQEGSFKEQTGFDNLFDMLRDFHQKTADMFADGDKSRVEIHCKNGKVKIVVDGVDIDWRERLEKNLYNYMHSIVGEE